MKMENQYKTEGELYVLANLLKQAGTEYSGGRLIYILPIGWDNEQLVGYLIRLSKKFGFGFKNLTCDIKMWNDILPQIYEKMERAIKENPRSEYAKRQKRFMENKFSIADIEKELDISLDDALDKILGNDKSLFETISFNLDISSAAKIKIEKYLGDMLSGPTRQDSSCG